jgi:hypothetical protein
MVEVGVTNAVTDVATRVATVAGIATNVLIEMIAVKKVQKKMNNDEIETDPPLVKTPDPI